MTKRDVVRTVLDGRRPPYVPWSFGFTVEAAEKLRGHYAARDMEEALGNHIIDVGMPIGHFDEVGDDCVRDVFGVVWDRSVDKDIGTPRGCVLPEPTLRGYDFPDPADPRFTEQIDELMGRYPDRFTVYSLGFSLYERAWSLRGMENLLVDFLENPDFVRDLLDRIVDFNIGVLDRALEFGVDGVRFGDDWGQQHGLQMGPRIWREFLKAPLTRMYGRVRDAGRYVLIHSCGDVDELFDELVEMGVHCFNPFQPEVMDVHGLLPRYRGRLCFHGGLSTQRTLPYGTADDVRRETQRLLERGAAGGYILAPAHDVEGDVPLENILAFIEAAQAQAGYAG